MNKQDWQNLLDSTEVLAERRYSFMGEAYKQGAKDAVTALSPEWHFFRCPDDWHDECDERCIGCYHRHIDRGDWPPKETPDAPR